MAAGVLSGLCGLLVAVLLWAEANRSRPARIVSKLLASACVLAAGTSLRWPLHEPEQQWVVVGLALGLVGDALLLGNRRRFVLLGLIVFLLGHLAYVTGWSSGARLSVATLAAGLVVAISGIALFAARAGSMKPHVAVYSLVVGAMVATALSCPDRPFLWCGALAFAVSDAAVARHRFVKESLLNKLWGLPLYYLGQLLIAWSA